ncbi:MAG: hypothetical protein JO030_08495 [Candidatus Eremiobacteraeota bacterium]|nr:hypothetical protein [Candidatus Eremiobacteraeota bacterium]
MWKAQGFYSSVRAERRVTLLRGRRDGLEVTLPEHAVEHALDQLEARLASQPGFYSGSAAVANFGDAVPEAEVVERLRCILACAGVTLRALTGTSEAIAEVAARGGLEFESHPQVKLSAAARSLVADFAGARQDIAERRSRGEASVPRQRLDGKQSRQTALRLVEALPSTLYHRATLRGGQVLHHTGNVVVVGDVNPGAELIATGDVVVFGRLGGIAHAGAAGDPNARIYAVELLPTQLRIATYIAAERGRVRRTALPPEAALVRDGQIAIVPLERLADVSADNVPS